MQSAKGGTRRISAYCDAAHFTGASSELVAAAWFLAQGKAVYFPAIQQCIHDFVVLDAGVFVTVQVKTATLNRSGRNGYIQCRTRLTNRYQKHLKPADIADIWVIVYRESLWVIPGREIDTSNLCLGCDRGLTTKRHWKWEAFRVR